MFGRKIRNINLSLFGFCVMAGVLRFDTGYGHCKCWYLVHPGSGGRASMASVDGDCRPEVLVYLEWLLHEAPGLEMSVMGDILIRHPRT